MTPIVAIVGRPNVGKSTLFNRLTRTRQALVDNLPGVTRDRLYGRMVYEGRELTVVDTGGFDPPADQPFADEVHAQIAAALAEADAVIFLTDARAGLNPQDAEVAGKLRRTSKPVFIAVNKVDGPTQEMAAQEFYALGAEHLFFISSAHGLGVGDLLDAVLEALPPAPEEVPPAVEEFPPEPGEGAEETALSRAPEGPVQVALIGRPNVGKSSLLNSLLGEDRVVVSQVPGTTRDAVDTPFSLRGRDFVLIDTAGIRRRGRIQRGLEKASVFRSLRAIERAQVVVVLLDASEGVTDQDLALCGQAVESHRGLVVCLNKWDLLAGDEHRQEQVLQAVERGLRFAPWVPVLKISALQGRGVKKILPLVGRIFDEYGTRLATGPLNQALERLLESHSPPSLKGRRLKFFYATQVSSRPPTVVIFVNEPAGVHFSYRRYLHNELRRALGLKLAPLKLIFRERSGRRPRGRS